jgi:ATP-dependent helicase/nuclease subunit A
VVDVPGAPGMTSVLQNPEQRAAVEAGGRVFVSAGAGTGKTSVLVERFVRAVCERGLDVDSILVITYTKRAAGELRSRIRRELRARDRLDLARALDGAWISTIHGFCNRLLRTYPFEAGLDPRFRELEEAQAAVLAGEAFDEALDEFCSSDEPERIQLLATYGASALRRMLTGIFATLRSAGRPLVLELGGGPSLEAHLERLRDSAACLADDAGATELQRANAGRIVEIMAANPPPERLLDLSAHRAYGERAATYEESRKLVEQAALDELALRDRDLLQDLLNGFAAAYARAKQRESAVDFEDLQLAARDLLRSHAWIRDREPLNFRAVMVDEFQDTNRLQCELIDLISRSEPGEAGLPPCDLFFVGDEFQSIYGFRHADVRVFRERREAEGGGLVLSRNYRSRAEVLTVVNYLFRGEFGEEFQPLTASGEFPDPVFGHPVELLVTDKAAYADSGLHWRRAEARQIAGRVHELIDSGAATAGEIVLLFAAGTDAEWYEEELRAAGLPTYRATGRGYFGQQQVADLLAYLRLLQNRYDDQALVTVLTSPFVGVSNDALVLIRRAGGRRPLFVGIEREVPAELDDTDARLVRAFKQRYDRLAALTARLSLERLCEQIVVEHDYDLAVLAQWDGKRRYANLRKLARLARAYEQLRGPDLQGFVRFVREQESVGAKELEAVAEEEGADAVRLLTIHAAKGLEFKVVVVADAGRERPAPAADEILALSDGRFGFRVAHPVTSERRPAFDYEAVRELQREEERAERLRLYYVAMTRAIDRLIVSGAVDRERPDALTPMGWVLDRLAADDELAQAEGGPVELERDGARLLVRIDRGRFRPVSGGDAEEAGVHAAAGTQLELFAADGPAAPPPGPSLPPLPPPAEPPLQDVRVLSFTQLATFERCSYRYYAERVVGMRDRKPVVGVVDAELGGGLGAIGLGSAVHAVLERIDLRQPAVPADLAERIAADFPDASPIDVERIRELVDAYCRSELASRMAALEDVRVECGFTFEHDGVLLRGYLDVLHSADGRALVVDYKTNALAEAGPEEVVEEEYRLQRLVYALACFRAGADEVEVAYVFLERPDAVVSARFQRDVVPALEAELSEAIGRLRAGEFRPTPSDYACAGCPALDVVCAGPNLQGATRGSAALVAAPV